MRIRILLIVAPACLLLFGWWVRGFEVKAESDLAAVGTTSAYIGVDSDLEIVLDDGSEVTLTFEADLSQSDPNNWSTIIICDPNAVSGQFEKDRNFDILINIWASDGVICEAIGHKWGGGGFFIRDNGEEIVSITPYRHEQSHEAQETQECMVCEKKRSRHLTEWE